MIIERSGAKFWAPDDSAKIVNDKWEVNPQELIPYDVWLKQQDVKEKEIRKKELQRQLDELVFADVNVNNELLNAAVDQYNEQIIAEQISLQNEIDSI